MENRPPNVFVSSTMYDLSHLRARLRELIEELGWRAVMAEHGAFPIDAAETTVENSVRNVRENADVFVMVVGARYGSVDSDTDKSVTNLEFLEARAGAVPVYVFVASDVLAQLQVWRANPDADYSSVVDTPRVFEFIDSFYGTGEVWSFPFVDAEDIVGTLREQLAFLVQDALGLRRMAHDHDRLLEELEGDALMLALRQGENWEPRLFGTVLEAELDRRAPLRREVEHGLSRGDVTHIDVGEFASWGLDRIREFSGLADTAEAVINDYLPLALRDEGIPADALELVDAARRLAGVWEDCLQWTLRCRSVRVDPEAEPVVEALSDANANMLNEIWDFGHNIIPRLDEAIRAHAAGDPGVVEMNLTLTADFDSFNEELARYERKRAF